MEVDDDEEHRSIPVEVAIVPAGYSSVSTSKAAAIDPVELEGQLVKVPYEFLKRSFRAGSRVVDKEMHAVVSDLGKAAKEGLSQRLDSCVGRLVGLKRKLSEISQTEETELRRCRARLEYLNALKDGENKDQGMIQLRRTKLDRILVDYMLRSSYLKTAAMLMKSSPIQEDLADLRIFEEAQKVLEGLKDRDCSLALAWCSENKARLKKAESILEFKLRVQEFIELARANQALAAVQYAKRHLASWAKKHLKDLQQAMVALSLGPATQCSDHKKLYSECQWDKLIELFKEDFCKIHELPTEPLLYIHLQAGLAALKTLTCEVPPKESPLSNEAVWKIAEPLPYATKEKSTLVCYISRQVMDGENPPLVLPNGYAYSTKSLEAMARENEGMVTCPRTGQSFALDEAKRIFVSM